MRTKVSIYLTLASALFLNACATTYTGPNPNFSLKGKDAELEVAKFTINDSYWAQRADGFSMGPSGEVYTNDSIIPVMKSASQRADDKLDAAKTVRIIEWVTLAAAFGMLIAANSTDNSDTKNTYRNLFWVGLGTSTGLGLYYFSMRSSAASLYNEDLKNKFSPGVSFNLNY